MKSALISGALYGCLGLGVVDVAALNLLVLPSIHEEAAAIAASPRLVPVQAFDAPAAFASVAPTGPELPTVQPEPVAIVEFYRSSYRVNHLAQRVLVSVVPTLGTLGPVTVVGHADATGTDDLNDRLSEQRAEAVARRLVTLGIRPVRVRLEARGARQPRGQGSDRRVEIFLGDAP